MSDGAVILWVIVRYFLAFGVFCGVVWLINHLCGRRLRETLLKGVGR